MSRSPSTVFNSYAEQYDLFRPGYPNALAGYVTEYAATPKDYRANILEIGCGSGQATVIFADSSSNIICVDPSPKLIALAKSKLNHHYSVRFHVSKLEDVALPENSFDIVIAGQSFHWIDDGNGYMRVHNLLKPNGTVALFWNSVMYTGTQVEDALLKINQTLLQHPYTPDNWNDCVSSTHTDDFNRFVNSGYFSDPLLKTFDWSLHYTAAQYCGLQMTYSNIYELADERKKELVSAYTQAIATFGGFLQVTYRTHLYIGRSISLSER